MEKDCAFVGMRWNCIQLAMTRLLRNHVILTSHGAAEIFSRTMMMPVLRTVIINEYF